ncbi:MAG TPA: protein-S-isoprenylcysteine O-methyltransferase [Candidatus Acidoferrum sp.]|nr:protein-S-isoprenylcysteine O-methyltransferase [Candidatus Acidoferrum sp.]
MTPSLAKAVFVVLAIGWYVIRYPYERRARRNPVRWSERGPREYLLMAISTTGFGLLPLLYICFDFPRSANYTFHPTQAWLGVLVALGSLIMFRLTHRALGHFWSVSLDVRERHALVTDGVYRYVRHPMYTAFWLWAIAQALLLPNWVAGFAAILGFGVLFFGRLAREEQMLLNSFGDEYRKYMARTSRLLPGIY